MLRVRDAVSHGSDRLHSSNVERRPYLVPSMCGSSYGAYDTDDTTTEPRYLTEEEVFAPFDREAAWQSAMNQLREWGFDPDEVVAQAERNLAACRLLREK